MVTFTFTKYGKSCFDKLSQDVKDRVLQKLLLVKGHPDIFSLLLATKNLDPATHRLRVGSYRLLVRYQPLPSCQLHFYITKIGHRKDIYS